MARELQTLNEQKKLALWAERVNACRSSGRTVKDWCKERGICEQTYYRCKSVCLKWQGSSRKDGSLR